MTTKNILILTLLFTLLLLTSCGQNVLNSNPNNSIDRLFLTDTQFFAGQNIPVGNVTVKTDNGNLLVNYNIDNLQWCITEVHTYASIKTPKKAAPGSFPYKQENLDCVQEYSEVIPFSELKVSSGDTVYIAAHAVVNSVISYQSDLKNLLEDLNNLPVDIVHQHPSEYSYFKTTVFGNDVLTGQFKGWCIDFDTGIYPGTDYQSYIYSSDSPEAASLVEYPENFDLVNYLVNQNWPGKISPSNGTYTYGDVQRAIWTLLDDDVGTSGLGIWSEKRVAYILADAKANGENFEPTCGDEIALVVNPVAIKTQELGNIAQATILVIPFPCKPVLSQRNETAWAKGTSKFKTGWGSFFAYLIN